MQLITFGLFLLVCMSARAYPVADNEEIQTAAAISGSEPQAQIQDSQASSSSSEENSSEEAKPATTEAASEDSTRTELPASSTLAPKLEAKREEPKLDLAQSTESEQSEKIEEPAAKPIDARIPDIVQTAKSSPAIAEESPSVKSELPQAPLEASTEKIEKPLALPTLEAKKDDLAPQPSEQLEEKVAAPAETPAPLVKSSTPLEGAGDETKDVALEKVKREEVLENLESSTANAATLATSGNLEATKTIEEPKKEEQPLEEPKKDTLKKEEIPEKLPEPSASS